MLNIVSVKKYFWPRLTFMPGTEPETDLPGGKSTCFSEPLVGSGFMLSVV